MYIKIILTLFSVGLFAPQLMSQNAMESQLTKLFEHAEMKEFFKGHNEYVIVPTEACNATLCDPHLIKAKMPVKFYTTEETFLRNSQFMSVLQISQSDKTGKTLYLLKLRGNKTIKIEV